MMRMPVDSSDRVEMPEQAFLARLVVIRRNDQSAIEAQLFRGDCGRDCLARGIRTRSRQHLTAAARDLQGQADDLFPLIVRKRRALARGADGDDAGDAGRDLPLDQFLESGSVDCAVTEGRDESRVGTAEHLCASPKARPFLRTRNRLGRSASH